MVELSKRPAWPLWGLAAAAGLALVWALWPGADAPSPGPTGGAAASNAVTSLWSRVTTPAQTQALPALEVAIAASAPALPPAQPPQAPSAAEKLVAALGHPADVDASNTTSSLINLARDQRTAGALEDTPPAPARALDTRLPIYPGAVEVPEQSVRSGAQGQAVTAVLTSTAPLASVVAFYRQRQDSHDDARVFTLLPTGNEGLDLREVNTRERVVYRMQVAPVDSTVYIRLSRHPLP